MKHYKMPTYEEARNARVAKMEEYQKRNPLKLITEKTRNKFTRYSYRFGGIQRHAGLKCTIFEPEVKTPLDLLGMTKVTVKIDINKKGTKSFSVYYYMLYEELQEIASPKSIINII